MFEGLNVLLLARYLAFSHLRHSPVPLHFPRRVPDVRVSPQMLQAHHSVEARHHDRNFGAALAIWDWMFGTLVMPRQGERFEFGV
jgi:sterol desaturase/sphingolipid hydroxylase (fatty acid hydroxylase superfamily)